MQSQTRRNGTIDFFRFVFALMIVAYHSGIFFRLGGGRVCGSGYIAVEFFFIVSGYLLAAKAARFEGGSVWDADLALLKDRFLGVFPYLFLAVLASNAVYTVGRFQAVDVWHRLIYCVTDLFALQMEGYPGFYATGVAWYLSVLFMISFLLYPLLVRRGEMICKFVAPAGAVLLLGVLARVDANLSFPDNWYGAVYKGMLRGLADMLLGCAGWALVRRLDAQEESSPLYGLFEIGGFAAALLFGAFHDHSDSHDFLIVPLLFMAVTLAFSNKSALARLFAGERARRRCGLLGALSLSVYLNHVFVAENMTRLFPVYGPNRRMLIYLAAVAALSALNWLLGRLLARRRVFGRMRRVIAAALALMLAGQCLYFVGQLRADAAVSGFAGEGTAESPWLVRDAGDLRRLRDLVNAGRSFRDGHFLQTADIDLAGENWMPIGIHDTDHYFYGDYDGGCHAVYNLTIRSHYTRDTGNVALFGMLCGTVRNLGVESGEVRGYYAAAIASQGADGARILNCYNKAEIIGEYRAAGICDNFVGGEVVNCVNEGGVRCERDGAPVVALDARSAAALWPGEDALPPTFTGDSLDVDMPGATARERLNSGRRALIALKIIRADEAGVWPEE